MTRALKLWFDNKTPSAPLWFRLCIIPRHHLHILFTLHSSTGLVTKFLEFLPGDEQVVLVVPDLRYFMALHGPEAHALPFTQVVVDLGHNDLPEVQISCIFFRLG